MKSASKNNHSSDGPMDAQEVEANPSSASAGKRSQRSALSNSIRRHYFEQQESVIDYLQSNNLFNVFKYLLYRLSEDKPQNIREFLVKVLEELRRSAHEANSGYEAELPNTVCYTDEELSVLFNMIDKKERKSISALEAHSAFARLLGNAGAAQAFLREAPELPGMVTEAEFIKWVKMLLSRFSATHYELKEAVFTSKNHEADDAQ